MDITDAYKKHTDEDQFALRNNEWFDLMQTENDEYFVSLAFHIDDIEHITYFGAKTSFKEQLKAKQAMWNWYVASYWRGRITEAKAKLLDAVGYPNYCVVTPKGICHAAENKQNRKQFDEFCNIDICDNECMNVPVSQNGVNKVYYDKIKDELRVKMKRFFELILVDPDTPEPLEKRYNLPHGSPYKLVEGKLVEPKLIETVKMENINNANEKEERYYELLKEWKGFIKISVDITKEFDQFQQQLKSDFIRTGKDNELIEWDDRKYFLNDINVVYDKNEDKIWHDMFILLDSKVIHGYNDRFNYFDSFETMTKDQELKVLIKVFEFASSNWDVFYDYFDHTHLGCVCKKWYDILAVNNGFQS